MLSLDSGHKRRLGLLGAKRTTITVHRSEEILPRDVAAMGGGLVGPSLGHALSAGAAGLVRQGTSVSSGEEGGQVLDGDFGEGSERSDRDAGETF